MNLFFEGSKSQRDDCGFHDDPSGCPAVVGVAWLIPFLPVSAVAASALDRTGNMVALSGWKALGEMIDVLLSDPGLTCLAMSTVETHRLEMEPLGSLCSVDGPALAVEAMGIMATHPHLQKVTVINEFANYLDHSQKVSLACSIIGEEMGLEQVWIERLRIAGLLHDIGTLAIFTLESLASDGCDGPSEALIGRNPQLLGLLRHRGKHTCYGENTHLLLGEALVKEWGFPKYLAGAIRHHHNPLEPGGCELSAIIFLANFMILEFEGLKWETLFNPRLLQMVGLDGRKISLARRRIIATIHTNAKKSAGFSGNGLSGLGRRSMIQGDGNRRNRSEVVKPGTDVSPIPGNLNFW